MSLGMPAATGDTASRLVFGQRDWTVVALLIVAAVVALGLAVGLLLRRRRHRVEQHMGEGFTATAFDKFCSNMSWYGRSAAGPQPPVRPAPPQQQPRPVPQAPPHRTTLPSGPIQPAPIRSAPIRSAPVQSRVIPPIEPRPGRHAAPPN